MGAFSVAAGLVALLCSAIAAIARGIRRDLDDVADMRSVALARATDARDGAVVCVAGRVVDEGEMLLAPSAVAAASPTNSSCASAAAN